FWSFDRLQLLPPQRRRYRRAGKPSQAISRDNGLRLTVSIDVEQDLALPVILLDLQRHRRRACIHKGLCDSFGRFERLVKPPFWLDGCDYVQPLSARRFEERMIPK